MVTVAEIEAELERDDKQKSSDNGVATVKHLDRTYMGMLEYKKEDEPQLIKCLIMGQLTSSTSLSKFFPFQFFLICSLNFAVFFVTSGLYWHFYEQWFRKLMVLITNLQEFFSIFFSLT